MFHTSSNILVKGISLLFSSAPSSSPSRFLSSAKQAVNLSKTLLMMMAMESLFVTQTWGTKREREERGRREEEVRDGEKQSCQSCKRCMRQPDQEDGLFLISRRYTVLSVTIDSLF